VAVWHEASLRSPFGFISLAVTGARKPQSGLQHRRRFHLPSASGKSPKADLKKF